MNLVVLDGHTLNPGDLSWEPLARLGSSFTVYDRTPPDQVEARSASAEILFTNKTPLDCATLERLPAVRYIGVLATGTNVVDLAAARARGIPVTNVPAYGTAAVAQMVFALIFALARRVEHHAAEVRRGRWASSPDFCFWDYPQIDLAGLTLGIVGFGHIGRAVAHIGQAFGMEIRVHSRSRPADLPPGMTWDSLENVLREADILTLHCPLTPENRHFLNGETLRLMKPSAFLINTGRGPLIEENALAEALRGGHLAGAGLDVLGVEPPASAHPLYGLENCLITPHLAWATLRARSRLLTTAAANLLAWLQGSPCNVVNP